MNTFDEMKTKAIDDTLKLLGRAKDEPGMTEDMQAELNLWMLLLTLAKTNKVNAITDSVAVMLVAAAQGEMKLVVNLLDGACGVLNKILLNKAMGGME